MLKDEQYCSYNGVGDPRPLETWSDFSFMKYYLQTVINFFNPICMVIIFYDKSTSTTLVTTGPQDPTVHLTQSVWMAVAPPIFVANKN